MFFGHIVTKKKKRVACTIREVKISGSKRFKFNEIGLGRFPSLSLSEGALGLLQYLRMKIYHSNRIKKIFMLTSDSIPIDSFQDLETEEGRNKNQTKKIPVVFFIML